MCGVQGRVSDGAPSFPTPGTSSAQELANVKFGSRFALLHQILPVSFRTQCLLIQSYISDPYSIFSQLAQANQINYVPSPETPGSVEHPFEVWPRCAVGQAPSRRMAGVWWVGGTGAGACIKYTRINITTGGSAPPRLSGVRVYTSIIP